ncbi:chitin synthase export chaperone [Vairimorpha necatrix]|uniref:Chitin synthase export chaperone n=1 Tax=Vairimorpha necatrix TaxID=6039 RepID=A0AAX4JFW3_9MICR
MIITDYICSEIDLPLCKYISQNACNYSSRYEYLGKMKIYSPTFLCLLICNLGMINWMIGHVQNLCSSIGRTEMSFFYYLYAMSNFLQMFLICLKDKVENMHFILTVLHLIISNMCFFSLLVGSYTQDMFTGKWGVQSNLILYSFTAAYGFLSAIVIFFGLLLRSSVTIFVSCLVSNFIIGYAYYVKQFRKLNKIKGEIWAYGTILISLLFFALAVGSMFIDSKFIGILTDKYIDNLFFHNLFLFCAIVMIHKFWLSVCDYEVECLLLDIK